MKKELLIAKAFWRTAIGNKANIGLMVVILILFVYAGYSCAERFVTKTETQQHYQHEAREAWLANPDKHPHRMAHYGHFAFRPSSPLSFFDTGMESFFGNAIFLEAHVQNTSNFSEAGFSTGMLRFGEISIASVFQIVIPLLIVFLGFNSIAAERESGTLKLYFTQGVGWKQLLLGKTMGLFAFTMTMLLPLMLCAVIGWSMIPGINIDGDEIIRSILLFFAYLIYFAIICISTTLVSASCRSSKTALTLLIGIWLLFVVILPKTAQSLGGFFYKTPSKTEFTLAVEADIIKTGDSHNPDDPYYKNFKDSVLKANRVDSVQDLPFNYSGLMMKEGERITAEINNAHTKRLQQIFRKQNEFSAITAFVDPFIGIKNLSMAIAGTDYASYLSFQEQAEHYRYNLAQTMNDLQIKFITNKSLLTPEQPAIVDKKYWASIEDFHFDAPPVASIFRNEIISLLSLLCWVVVLAVILTRLSKSLNVV